MGIKQADLSKVPAISEMLGRAYGRAGKEFGQIVPGNPRQAIDDLRFSEDPVAVKFLETYDSIPAGDRRLVSIEAICLKANVSPQEFLGHVFLMRQSLCKAESSMTAVNAFPGVVRDMVASASLLGLPGAADRKMLVQHTAIGFLPAPKGQSISVNLFGGEASFSGDDEKDDPEWAGFNDAFGGGNKELEQWNNDRRLLLEDGKVSV